MATVRANYAPHEYALLLEFCIRTTNLNPKAESILRSIAQKLYCNMFISTKQYEALHNIAADCADITHHQQTVLRSVANSDPEPMPVFTYNDGILDFPQTIITDGGLNVPNSGRNDSGDLPGMDDYHTAGDAPDQGDEVIPGVPEGPIPSE